MVKIIESQVAGEKRFIIRADHGLEHLIKKLPDVKYEPGIKAWHVPYTSKSRQALISAGLCPSWTSDTGTIHRTYKDVHTGINRPGGFSPAKSLHSTSAAAGISTTLRPHIHWSGNEFQVAISYSVKEVAFLRQLKGAYWAPEIKKWMVRSTLSNLASLQSRYSSWTEDDYKKLYDLIRSTGNHPKAELYVTPEYKGRFVLKISGGYINVDFLKKVADRYYDKATKRWIFPLDKNITERLLLQLKEKQVEVINRIPLKAVTYQKKLSSLGDRKILYMRKVESRYKETVNHYMDKMISMRYSWSTIKHYSGYLIQFMNFLPSTPLSERTVDQANAFIAVVSNENISESRINGIISAIKLYYDKIVFRPDFDLEKVDRPRKSRTLPTILSKKEIQRIFQVTKNLKHMTMLFTLYSSGLRLNEILSLKIQDIHWDRNQLYVRHGKGKKDRMVMLSATLKEVLHKYFDEYQPQYWLFEGADRKNPYSSSSLQKVVKRMAKRAGITRKVSTHTLRHCFATHLLDNGVDIRYIQTLLGHASLKTTTIYTHVTNNKLTDITSPLDSLFSDHDRGYSEKKEDTRYRKGPDIT